MALKLKALKSIGMSNSENPDTYVEQKSDDEVLAEIESLAEEKVRFAEWKRVDVEKKRENFQKNANCYRREN